jgi:hypothetical protein
MKQKTFDCVEMKRQAQARLMAATDPKTKAFREKIVEAQRDPTSDARASR